MSRLGQREVFKIFHFLLRSAANNGLMHINSSTSAAVFRWNPACWLHVTGEDAASFLQGQFTNDLRGLEPGAAAYGLWLTVKGKVLGDSFVVAEAAGGGAYWVGSYSTAATLLRERLEAYVIADDVAIEDQTAEWEGAGLVGVSAADARTLCDELRRAAPHVVAFPGRRDADGGVECVYRRTEGPPSRWTELTASLPRIDAVELARRRIVAGVPAIPADIGGADLPNEGGLEQDAISFTKGCYLGQEVMARLKSMGQVRRRLVRVHGPGVPPPVPAPLYVGAKTAGELRSAAMDGTGWVGLALLSLLQAPPEAALALDPAGVLPVQRADRP